MRLNPNQVTQRVRSALAVMEGVDDDQLYTVLDMAGFIGRLRQSNFIDAHLPAVVQLAPDPEEEDRKEEFDLEAATDEVVRRLHQRAMDGDSQSARTFYEMTKGVAPPERFNIQLNITPYTIKDPSLRNITMQAAPNFVDEILEGMLDRLRMDEAPKRMRQEFESWTKDFRIWAERHYAPKDD